MINKYRIKIILPHNSEDSSEYLVQTRLLFFWITVKHCNNYFIARNYITTNGILLYEYLIQK